MQVDPITSLKTCRTCQQAKPLDAFYRHSRTADGYRVDCKECGAFVAVGGDAKAPDYFKRYYAANKERVKAQRKEYREAHPEQVAAMGKRYRQENPEKVAARVRQYVERNQERIAERRREYMQRPEVKARYAAASTRRRQENPEARREREKQWRAANPERARNLTRVSNHKRRTDNGSFTTQEWDALCEKYGQRCLRCRRTDRPLTVDHVIPIALGGSNWIANVQPLCAPCNSSKKQRIIDYRPLEQTALF